MDSSNVDSVFIAGNPVKRKGKWVGVDVDHASCVKRSVRAGGC